MTTIEGKTFSEMRECLPHKNTYFVRCTFSDVRVVDDFFGHNNVFTDCTFQSVVTLDCDFGNDLGVNTFINCSFTDCRFKHGELSGCNSYEQSAFEGCTFTRTSIRNYIFPFPHFTNCVFDQCYLVATFGHTAEPDFSIFNVLTRGLHKRNFRKKQQQTPTTFSGNTFKDLRLDNITFGTDVITANQHFS